MKNAYLVFASLLIAALAPVGCLIGSAALVCLGGFLAVLVFLAGVFFGIRLPFIAMTLYRELNTRLSRAKTTNQKTEAKPEQAKLSEAEKSAREVIENFHRASAGRYASGGGIEPFPQASAPNTGASSGVRE